MDESFICGHKLPEDAKLSFSPDKLCWIHFWSDPRCFGTQWDDALRQCKALYSPFYNDAARTLATVSWVAMVTDCPRQIPESPCHISTQQPTFSPCFIWRASSPAVNIMSSLTSLSTESCGWGREPLYNGWICPFYQKPLLINAYLRYIQEIKELKLVSNTLFLGNLWNCFCFTIQLVCVCVCVCVHVCVVNWNTEFQIKHYFTKTYW